MQLALPKIEMHKLSVQGAGAVIALATLAVLLLAGILVIAMLPIKGADKTMLGTAWGFVTALVKDCFNYFTGTTASSQAKTALIAQSPAIAPGPVVQTAAAQAEPLDTKIPAPQMTFPPPMMAFGHLVSQAFKNKVHDICAAMSWDPVSGANNLMACMAWESGETFSASVKNKAGSGATGLIQFMPKVAEDLGTTVEKLAEMSAVEQLDYVLKYFRQFSKMKGPQVTLADMYMAILLPKYIGTPEDAVLFSEGVAFRQNSGLDTNHDGKVTKIEAAGKVYAKLERGLTPAFVG
jgi:hypothetical protein